MSKHMWHIGAGVDVANDIVNHLRDFGCEAEIDMDCIAPPCVITDDDGDEILTRMLQETYGV